MGAAIGHTRWAICEGDHPTWVAEPEPKSRDISSLLMAGDLDRHVAITVYLPERDPAGPYRLKTAACGFIAP